MNYYEMLKAAKLAGGGGIADTPETRWEWHEDWQNMTEFEIPEGVTAIPAFSFAYCSKLSDVKLPSTLTGIGIQAFRYSAIKEMYVPSSVNSIGSNAFGNCDNLDTITIDKAEGSISGAPWGATKATIIWTG